MVRNKPCPICPTCLALKRLNRLTLKGHWLNVKVKHENSVFQPTVRKGQKSGSSKSISHSEVRVINIKVSITKRSEVKVTKVIGQGHCHGGQRWRSLISSSRVKVMGVGHEEHDQSCYVEFPAISTGGKFPHIETRLQSTLIVYLLNFYIYISINFYKCLVHGVDFLWQYINLHNPTFLQRHFSINSMKIWFNNQYCTTISTL